MDIESVRVICGTVLLCVLVICIAIVFASKN